MGMVYSAPAAPIKVAFMVAAGLMGTWVPDNFAQAYAARSVLHSVIEAASALLYAGLLRLRSNQAGERMSSEW
jgi:hypothetical protein